MNPALTIRIKRHADESASITLTRMDGTVTWQRQKGKLGAVFPPHDITHFAVETTLGLREGFYGLVADGWDIADFAAPWPRGEIPPEAREVELIVGCLDSERRSIDRWSADAFNEHAKIYVSTTRFSDMRVPVLTEQQLDAVRTLRDSLLARWAALQPGESLELSFLGQ
jgi:hypothetical protein